MSQIDPAVFDLCGDKWTAFYFYYTDYDAM